MFFLAATLIGCIGGDFAYRKPTARVREVVSPQEESESMTNSKEVYKNAQCTKMPARPKRTLAAVLLLLLRYCGAAAGQRHVRKD